MALVSSLLCMLEGVIVAGVAEDQFKLETAFVFCTIWAFGSALMMSDDGVDHRKAFSDWWKTNFKHIRLPTRETTFDYWLDPASNKFEPWRQSPSFHAVAFDSRIMKMDETTVPTTETASISHWGNLFIHQSKSLLLVGPSGPKEAISLADCASCFLLSFDCDILDAVRYWENTTRHWDATRAFADKICQREY